MGVHVFGFRWPGWMHTPSGEEIPADHGPSPTNDWAASWNWWKTEMGGVGAKILNVPHCLNHGNRSATDPNDWDSFPTAQYDNVWAADDTVRMIVDMHGEGQPWFTLDSTVTASGTAFAMRGPVSNTAGRVRTHAMPKGAVSGTYTSYKAKAASGAGSSVTTKVAADYSSTATTITVDSAAALPTATPFKVTVRGYSLDPATTDPQTQALREEIMSVTGIAGNVLTVTRAVDGTWALYGIATALPHASASWVCPFEIVNVTARDGGFTADDSRTLYKGMNLTVSRGQDGTAGVAWPAETRFTVIGRNGNVHQRWLDGDFDELFVAFVTGAKTWSAAHSNKAVYLRPWFEMNGSWFGWGVNTKSKGIGSNDTPGKWNGNTHTSFKAMWQRMFNLARTSDVIDGTTGVNFGVFRFIWNPVEGDRPTRAVGIASINTSTDTVTTEKAHGYEVGETVWVSCDEESSVNTSSGAIAERTEMYVRSAPTTTTLTLGWPSNNSLVNLTSMTGDPDLVVPNAAEYCYPGDSYVSYVAANPYMKSPSVVSGGLTKVHFTNRAEDILDRLTDIAPSKSILITETGVHVDYGIIRKRYWSKAATSSGHGGWRAAVEKWPKIAAICYFNVNVSDRLGPAFEAQDWLVSDDPWEVKYNLKTNIYGNSDFQGTLP